MFLYAMQVCMYTIALYLLALQFQLCRHFNNHNMKLTQEKFYLLFELKNVGHKTASWSKNFSWSGINIERRKRYSQADVLKVVTKYYIAHNITHANTEQTFHTSILIIPMMFECGIPSSSLHIFLDCIQSQMCSFHC